MQAADFLQYSILFIRVTLLLLYLEFHTFYSIQRKSAKGSSKRTFFSGLLPNDHHIIGSTMSLIPQSQIVAELSLLIPLPPALLYLFFIANQETRSGSMPPAKKILPVRGQLFS